MPTTLRSVGGVMTWASNAACRLHPRGEGIEHASRSTVLGRETIWAAPACLLVVPLAMTLEGCGGESPNGPTTPSPAPAPAPTPTPTPAPLSLLAPPTAQSSRTTALDDVAVDGRRGSHGGLLHRRARARLSRLRTVASDTATRGTTASARTGCARPHVPRGTFPATWPGRRRPRPEREEEKPAPRHGGRLYSRRRRRTDTFGFTLPAGSLLVVVGPVLAGEGSLDVTLAYSGDFIILACVGTSSACYPMGGLPMTSRFNVPRDFPAGPIQAGSTSTTTTRCPGKRERNRELHLCPAMSAYRARSRGVWLESGRRGFGWVKSFSCWKRETGC